MGKISSPNPIIIDIRMKVVSEIMYIPSDQERPGGRGGANKSGSGYRRSDLRPLRCRTPRSWLLRSKLNEVVIQRGDGPVDGGRGCVRLDVFG